VPDPRASTRHTGTTFSRGSRPRSRRFGRPPPSASRPPSSTLSPINGGRRSRRRRRDGQAHGWCCHILGGGDVNRAELVERPSRPTNEGACGERHADAELLRAADHEPHACRVLYARWAEPLLAFCYRRTWDSEAALDLVAETFAIAYRNAIASGTAAARWAPGCMASRPGSWPPTDDASALSCAPERQAVKWSRRKAAAVSVYQSLQSFERHCDCGPRLDWSPIR
jgi:hypothetical protein